MKSVPSINMNIQDKLRNAGYRREFFLEENSARIAAQLLELRQRRGLSQAGLASLIGTRQSAVSRIENSSYSSWSITTLIKIADALDARLRVLIEPAEDVLKEYASDGKESDRQQLIFDGLAKKAPLSQDQRASAIDARQKRSERLESQVRGKQSIGLLDDNSSKGRCARYS